MTVKQRRTETLTILEFAAMAEIGLPVARQILQSGKGPGIHLGESYYIRRVWVERWLRGEAVYTSANPAPNAAKPVRPQRMSPFARTVERRTAPAV